MTECALDACRVCTGCAHSRPDLCRGTVTCPTDGRTRPCRYAPAVIVSMEPAQTCQRCGLVEIVRLVGRGFPPDAAKRRLAKRCAKAGCPSEPQYTAGVAGLRARR